MGNTRIRLFQAAAWDCLSVKRLDNYGTVHYVGPHYERNVGTGADTTETVTRFYVAQMGKMKRLIPFKKGSTLYYVVTDHLGGMLRTVNTSGNTIDDIRYHAFGGTRSGGTATPTDKRFTGQTLDLSTGLYWYGSRAYDPVLGRFVQADSVVPDYKNPQALNRYSYVLNNPVRYSDPTGNTPWDPEQDATGGGELGLGGEGPYEAGDQVAAEGSADGEPQATFDFELGPLTLGLREGGEENAVSTSLAGFVQTLDIFDASVTTAFAEIYGAVQLASLLLGPEAASPVFVAFSAAYTPVQAVLTTTDLVSIAATNLADIAAGRTGINTEGRSLYVGLDTTVAIGTFLPGLFPSALGSVVSTPFDAAQVAYDANRAGARFWARAGS